MNWSKAVTACVFLAFLGFQMRQWAVVERLTKQQIESNERVGKLSMDAMDRRDAITEKTVDKLIDAFRKEQRLIRDHDRKKARAVAQE